jgi:hypothetical protein
VIASSTDTLLLGISTVVGMAGALGVAYAVFRSSAEQRLKEVDQRLINDQNMLISRLEHESSSLKADLSTATALANNFRESLTQKAAVDHLAELLIKEEKERKDEHAMHAMIMKDILAQMKREHGTIG